MAAQGEEAEAAGLFQLAAGASGPSRKRWRLWDLHRGIHGALLALAFDADELQRLLRRARIEIPAEARYYDLHRHLCDACASRNTLSELVEKRLDQKFATRISALRGLRTGEALEDSWRQAWNKGRGLAALFWASLTHPCATDEIRADFYADVHALFFASLSARERFEDKIETLERRYHALERRHREHVAALEHQLQRAREPKSVEVAGAAQSEQFAALNLRLAHALQRAARAETRVRALEEKLRHSRRTAQSQRWQPSQEPEAAPLPASDPAPAASTVEVITRIPGVSIAYVGGRPGAVERIRDFCEKRGATFIPHDGGLEESPVRLDEMLERADVVFYPVDCISHEAAQHLKSHCKRTEKPFIPLRNASVSAFRRGIKSWCGLG